MSRFKKLVPLILLVVAALALAVVLIPKEEEPAGEAGGGGGGGFRLAVTYAEVESGIVTESVDLVGDVVSARRAVVGFERIGRVAEVLVDLGDRVERGALLAQLDDDVLEEQVAVAEAMSQAAQAEAEFARREEDRGREMGSTVLAPSDQDRREVNARTAEFRAQQQAADVRRLKAMLARGKLHAPFDAVVASRAITDGSLVSLGDPAFELVDLQNREVHLEIPAPVAAVLPQDAEVELRADELPGFTVSARLARLVPAAQTSTRTFRGIVSLRGGDPEGKLLPGMFVRARLVLQTVQSDTIVPADAVLEGPQGTIVYRIDAPAPESQGGEGGMPPAPTAALVPVRVVARTPMSAAVAPFEPGALKSGQRVVVTGVDNIFPNAALVPSPHRREPAGAPSGRPGGGPPGAGGEGAPHGEGGGGARGGEAAASQGSGDGGAGAPESQG